MNHHCRARRIVKSEVAVGLLANPINSYPLQCASVTNKTSHISATAAFAWRNICNDRVKMIAAHQPTSVPSIRACDEEGRRGGRRREPHPKIDNATSAAATADGRRAAKSFSPKIL